MLAEIPSYWLQLLNSDCNNVVSACLGFFILQKCHWRVGSRSNKSEIRTSKHTHTKSETKAAPTQTWR